MHSLYQNITIHKPVTEILTTFPQRKMRAPYFQNPNKRNRTLLILLFPKLLFLNKSVDMWQRANLLIKDQHLINTPFSYRNCLIYGLLPNLFTYVSTLTCLDLNHNVLLASCQFLGEIPYLNVG